MERELTNIMKQAIKETKTNGNWKAVSNKLI